MKLVFITHRLISFYNSKMRNIFLISLSFYLLFHSPFMKRILFHSPFMKKMQTSMIGRNLKKPSLNLNDFHKVPQ